MKLRSNSRLHCGVRFVICKFYLTFETRQGCGKALIGAVILNALLRSTASDAFKNFDLSKKNFEEHKHKLESAVDYSSSTTTAMSGKTLTAQTPIASGNSLIFCAQTRR